MHIAILGLGYVGLTGAGCLLKQGHTIIGIDPNRKKLDILAEGRSPIFEPGLEDLIAEGVKNGNFKAQPHVDAEVAKAEIAIVCVGTPSAADGSHNMSYIAEVSRQLALMLKDADRSTPLTVVFRSTIRPGTIEDQIEPFFKSLLGASYETKVELVYNPEFLRESVAINDYFHPPKIVIGTKNAQPSARMTELYKDITAPTFHTAFREAELTKFVDNTWHAVKVCFANEIGRVCSELEISSRKVHEIFASDTKLNLSSYYTRPGGAFGGSCLPKDVRALMHIADEVGVGSHMIDSLIRSNEVHKRFMFDLVKKDLPAGARVLMIGLAFKADSDDLRESPQLDLARRLIKAGFDLSIYDPGVSPDMLIGQNLGYTLSHLPNIADLMIDKDTAESPGFDLALNTNGRAHTLNLGDVKVMDLHTLA